MNLYGIERTLVDDSSLEGCYVYANEKMLANNLILVESDCETDDDKEYHTWVTLYHYNDYDSMMFTLAIDYFSPIQIFGIAREVKELLDTYELDEFLNIMRELSVSFTSSSMQSSEAHAKMNRESVLSYFRLYKRIKFNVE